MLQNPNIKEHRDFFQAGFWFWGDCWGFFRTCQFWKLWFCVWGRFLDSECWASWLFREYLLLRWRAASNHSPCCPSLFQSGSPESPHLESLLTVRGCEIGKNRIWWHTSLRRLLLRFLLYDMSLWLPSPKESQSLVFPETRWAFRGWLLLRLWQQSSQGRTSRFCSCFWGSQWFHRRQEHYLRRVQYFLPEAQQLVSFSCSTWVFSKLVLCFVGIVPTWNLPLQSL